MIVRDSRSQPRPPTTLWQLPLVGLWAGGEIGPEAIADLEGGVLRSGDTAMKTALQGFTAVFGVFVVPDRAAARRALLEEADTFA